MSGEEKNDESPQLFNNSSSEPVKVDGVGGLVAADNAHDSPEKTSVKAGLIETQNMQNENDRTAFDQPSTTDEVMKTESENRNIKAEADDIPSVASLKQADSCKNENNFESEKEVTGSTQDQSSYPTTHEADNTEQLSTAGESDRQDDGNAKDNEFSKTSSNRSSSSVSLKQSDSERNEIEFVGEKDKLISTDEHTSHGNNDNNSNTDQLDQEQPDEVLSEETLVDENSKSATSDNSNGGSLKQSGLDNNDAEVNGEKDVVTVSTEEHISSSNETTNPVKDQLPSTDKTTKQEYTNITENETPQSTTDDDINVSKQSVSDNNDTDGVKSNNDTRVESVPQSVPDVETSDNVPLFTNSVPGTETDSVVNSERETKTDEDKGATTEPTNQVNSSDTVDSESEHTDDQKGESSKRDSNTGANSKEQTPTKTINKSNKLVVENRTVSKLKSQRERKVSTSRDATRKISTPRHSTIKKEEPKPSISKDNKKSLPTRKFGVDHSKERPNQMASAKDVNVHKPSKSTADNQGAETPKQSQLGNKAVEKKPENLKRERDNGNKNTENKQQLPQSRKNSASEISSSTQKQEYNSTKESGQKSVKDPNTNSDTTYTVVNEKEERKKSPKVKWNEKTLQTKSLPNGDIKSNEINQEQEKELKTETIKENERNLTNSVEKNKSVAIIEESGENINEKDREAFNPKSILARAVWKKGGKEKPASGFVAMNGPAKSHSKASLAVRSLSTADEKDEKLSMESRRDSTLLSLDSMSHKSVDFRNTNPNPIPEEKPRSLLHNNNDSWIRSAIPYQPLSLSILCLFLNIFLPGTGTVLSGFSILCCGKTRMTSKDDNVTVTVCVNIWVGVAQLFTITFCLVGWFWSIAWGIKMVILSVEYRREQRAKREMELQAMALSAFGSPTRVRQLFNTTA